MHGDPKPVGITLRRARAGDAKAVSEIHEACLRRLCAPDYTQEQIEAWIGPQVSHEMDHTMVERDGEIMFVAQCSSSIVGFAAIDGDEVSALYVHPDHSQHGVGTCLLHTVEEYAASHGMARLRVASSVTASPFYTARGYRALGESSRPLSDDIAIRCIEMEKDLPGPRS